MTGGKTEVSKMSNVDNKYKSVKHLALPAQHTDTGNATFFANLYGQVVRHCHTSHKWLIWDGRRWAEDKTGEIYCKAKEAVRKMFRMACKHKDDEKRAKLVKHALNSQYESRLRAMINLVRSEDGIPVTQDALDSDPWLLNVENGTLDLRIGELRPHRQEDLITKLIPVPYEANATCPTWNAFLQRIMGGSEDLIRFLQKAIGYSLTGSTKEQVIFILYGTGANGKSTFLITIHSLLGDYARQTPTETLLTKWGNRIPNDVARLKGARFVDAAEAESGKHLAEGLIKQLTGGDKISARFLYGEYFEFDPTFKIFLAVNHKPTIRGSDHAIWRRIRLIPFSVTIPPEEQDKTLSEKLKTEAPGILRWAVEGCLLWQIEGLGLPDSVKAATAEYRSEMDAISDFIKEYCEVTPGVKTPFSDLFYKYQDWCIENEEEDKDQLSKKEFGQCLTEFGFAAGRNRALGRFREGIKLLL